MIAHANEFHTSGGVSHAGPGADWNPVPARTVVRPAAVMRSRPAPTIAADPGPSPGILPIPKAVAERRPAHRYTRRRPGVTVFGNLFPAAVFREIFGADNVVARMSIRIGIGALESIVSFGYPAIEFIRRRQPDDFITG